MNNENLASYLNNKEPYTEKVQSEIMQLLEKHPYFQIAHMLLLKSMNQIQPENYNNQLKISGSFISDKRKLFQFINSDIPITFEKKVEKKAEKKNEGIIKKEISSIEKTIPTKVPIEKTETKIETRTNPIIETTDKKIEKKEFETPAKKIETKKTITETKEIKKQPIKKKVDLPEEVIEKNADKNSKHKHNKIISDFFHTTEKKEISKVDIEDSKSTSIEKREEKREAPIIKKEIREEKNTVSELRKETPVKKNIIQEIKKEPTIKTVIKEVKTPEKEPITKKKIEKEPEREVFINKKEPDTPQSKKPAKETDAMNNIFSKIRQIKKEMNIDSESTPKTIDIKTEDENSQTKKTEIRKSSSGRVIKESFIGFDEKVEDKKEEPEQITKEKTELKESITQVEEQNKIKESELTAKDLFKKHKIKKDKTSPFESEQTVKKETPIETSTSPISKLVDIVNDGASKTVEPIKKETIIEEKREASVVKDEQKKKEEIASGSGNESVADAMLKRIAEKKRRLQQEKIEEERQKEEERKRELEAVDELIKSSTKKEQERQKPPIIEEEIKEEFQLKKEEPTQKTGAPVKKSNKLIDSFIENIDSLERIGTKEIKISGDVSLESTVESEEIMTETYADLLIEQKNYAKAIEVYNKLILKFPEKKTYFAIQIKKVESLIK